MREQVTLLRPWMMPHNHDLLAVVGLDYDEGAYTELIAWALQPDTHRPSAARRQRAWLESLRLPVGTEPWAPAEPITQRRGWEHYEAVGYSPDGSRCEPSFAVPDLTVGDALALAARFRQACVFYWDGHRGSLVWCA